MPNPQNGRFNAPQSLAQLTRGRGFNSELVGFLLPFATQKFFYKVYDFVEDTMDTDFAVSNSGGSGAADYVSLAARNGVIRGTTGTTDNGSVEVHHDSITFDAADNPGMEIRSKLDVVTGFALEFAFSDAPTTASTLNVSALSAAGAPTIASNGVTDQMGFVINTDLTLTTAAFYSKGTTDAASGAVLGTFTPTAATNFIVTLQLAQNKGFCIVDNSHGQEATLSLGPDTGVLMRPHVICATKNTTTKLHDVDYIRIWSERAV